MDIDAYQQLALRTAIQSGREFNQDDMLRFVLGVSDEAGEVAGAVKKYLRGDYPLEELRSRLHKELGDVFWYMVMVCYVMDIDPSRVLQDNVSKLSDREERGVIRGDGDER